MDVSAAPWQIRYSWRYPQPVTSCPSTDWGQIMGLVKGLFLFLVFVLLVVLLPLTLTASWARSHVYNEDRFVEAVDGVYSNDDVKQAIASVIARAVERRAEGTNWATFADTVALDAEARSRLQALDTDIGSFVEEQVLEILDDPRFDDVWVEVIRQTHPLVVQLLKGEDTDLVQTSNGIVRVNLVPFYDEINAMLADRGIDLSRSASIAPEQLQLTVFDGDEVTRAQEGLELLDRSVRGAMIAVGVLALLILLFTRRKSRALVVIGLAVILGMTIEIATLWLGGRIISGRMDTESEERAALAVFTETVSVLTQWALFGLLIGAVAMVLGLIFAQRQDPRGRSVYPR